MILITKLPVDSTAQRFILALLLKLCLFQEMYTKNIFVSLQAAPPFGPMFPLDYFDNEEYDIRTGEEWMFLGWDWKEHKMYPIPAKAFLPIRRSRQDDKMKKCKLVEEEKPKALSEITAVNLLTKTERLERFRRWLLSERYRRLTRDDTSAGTFYGFSRMEITLGLYFLKA